MNRNDIIEAGLRLVREEGLGKFTTRRLADALQVQGPALYHHYRSKEQLLGDMANRIIESTIDSMPSDLDWAAWNASFAKRNRNAMLSYRDGALLLIKAWPTDTMRRRTIPRLETPMLGAGFPEQVAREVSFSIASFTIGWVLNEQNEQIREFIVERMDPDQAFENALEMLLDGARIRLSRQTAA